MTSTTHGEAPAALGKYRLLRHLATGGMGEVFEASLPGALGFEKRLVVKTIRSELADDPRFVELFAAEAKTAVSLSHGNIVPIYELGRQDGVLYIAMGLVSGPSLAVLLEAHRSRKLAVPPALALFIVGEVLRGMAYAHMPGPDRPAVVHRDLTPRNVLLERSGQVMIVDFGIASPARTASSAGMGSRGYAPPEQVRAAVADPRADVFAVACLLYELTTLRRAFPTEGVWMDPDLSEVPPALHAALAAALSLEPQGRPEDAGAFLRALAPAVQALGPAWTEADLARHLAQVIEPTAAASPGAVGSGPTPVTALLRRTPLPAEDLTFATRIFPAAAPPARRRSWMVAAAGTATIVALAAMLAGAMWSRDGRRVDPGASVPTSVTPHEPPRGDPPSGAPSPDVSPAPNGEAPPLTSSSTAPSADPGPSRPAASGGSGRLTVTTPGLPWARVWIDGRQRKPTPLHEIPVGSGRHRLKVECPREVCGHARTLHDGVLTIEPGRTRTVTITEGPDATAPPDP